MIHPQQQQQRWPRGPYNDLHDASLDGAIERTIALLSRGLFDVNQGDPEGFTPLMIAAQEGHSHLANILLSSGAKVCISMDGDATALHISAHKGHLAVTVDLIKAGADLDAKGSGGATPLHLAAQNGHSGVMAALIEAGAELNVQDMQGATPLHLAAQNEHPGVVAALIKAGAGVNSRLWRDGCTPLYVAAKNGNFDIVKELLRAKANPLLTMTASGIHYVPLDVAAYEGYSEVVRELIQQVGIQGCGGDIGGLRALKGAASEQHVDIMATLVDAGVVDTGVALHNAAGCSREAAVKFLLQRELERSPTGVARYVNCLDPVGCTPLFSSIDVSHDKEGVPHLISPKVIRLLIDTGADTSSAVRVKKTPRGKVLFHGTPLAFTNYCLANNRVKVGVGNDATEEQMYRLEAVRRLLLRVDAVHAVSWLWVTESFLFGGAASEVSSRRTARKTGASGTQMASMLPILRRRRRGVLLAPLFRYSSYP